MFRKVIALSVFVGSAAIFAEPMKPKPLRVAIYDGSEEAFFLGYETTKVYDELCGLPAVSLTITKNAPGADRAGVIKILTSRMMSAACRKEPGQEEGSLRFGKGPYLPDLALGTYALWIDGEPYPNLRVGETSVVLSSDVLH